MIERPRRLRRTAALRRLVAETTLRPADLVLPLFVKEGLTEPVAVASMPGVMQHSRESLLKAAASAVEAGVGGLILFGVPADKNDTGSAASDPDGITQAALRDLVAEVGDSTVLIGDVCLCEYTSHGHCGPLLPDGSVNNDAAVARYADVAVAQAEAGAHVVAPSGMQDGQVAAIRSALDASGFADVAVLSYAAKYASAYYGPFRDAAESTPAVGDRRGYQMDPANADEALREVGLDLAEGADMVMVKPAGPYLDVLARVADAVDVPVAAYQVSGEYAAIEAAAANGWLDRERAHLEALTGIKRAGASFILTYAATSLAPRLA